MSPARPSQRKQKPLASRRHDEILKRIDASGSVSVSEVADHFSVAYETVRRDFKLLADRGRLAIVHGGATRRAAIEPAMDVRAAENAAGKAAIARAAAALVEDGMTLLLDSGTTTLALAHALEGKRGLTICTGALAIALHLSRQPDIKVQLLGGEIDPREEAASGVDAIEAVQRFRVDIAFIGAGGLTPDGEVTDYSRAAAELRGQMIASAARAYFLIDHSKFGRLTPVRVPAFAAASGIITDRSPPMQAIRNIKKIGLHLLVGRS